MGITSQGFWLILGIGLVLLIAAALVDRRARIRAERTRTGITDPEATPEYVLESELAAGQLPPLPEEIITAETDAPHLALRLLDGRFATYSGGNSVLYDADVLVLADVSVSSMRELVRVLQRAAAAHTPLVLATAGVTADVCETLVANHLAGKLTLQVLCDDSDDETALTQLATISNATPVTLRELLADDVPDEVYGKLVLSVANADPPRVWVSTHESTAK